MLFDTHAHFNDEAFDTDRAEAIEKCQKEEIIVNVVGYDLPSSELALKLSAEHRNLYASLGMHPHDSKSYDDSMEAFLLAQLHTPRVLALGEIGLDYHYDYSPRDIQRDIFIRQIELANELNVPIIIHSREAVGDTFDILKQHLRCPRGAVLHSFNQSEEMLREYLRLDRNIYFSISGPVTFKNARALAELAPKIPRELLLIETDSPYLTPHPHRGTRNEPGYVRLVAEKLAELCGIAFDETADITTANALRFFGLSRSF